MEIKDKRYYLIEEIAKRTNTSLENAEKIIIQKEEENIGIVMRQTNYTYDEAKNKLLEYDFNYLLVIEDYMGIKKKNKNEIVSINQSVYKEIRNCLDQASHDYRIQKEIKEKKEELINSIKNEKMPVIKENESFNESNNED
tara:strand:+ start:466 stop:888 length:423 start_codon:yes stop_codon:yes gene_type:complete